MPGSIGIACHPLALGVREGVWEGNSPKHDDCGHLVPALLLGSRLGYGTRRKPLAALGNRLAT